MTNPPQSICDKPKTPISNSINSNPKTHSGSTYRTPNNKQSLLLFLHPLNNLTRTLSKCIAIGIRSCDAIKLEDRGNPSERTGRLGDAVVDFDVCVFGVDAGVEVVIC